MYIVQRLIGVGVQSTVGGTKFLPEKYVFKISKMPEFYMIFARKMPEFYAIIARKIFFPKFRGHVPAPSGLPLPPTHKPLRYINPCFTYLHSE